MKGIRDHPNWWVVLSYDGYGSHLQNDALEVFAAEKNLVMKEEGDTSQVSQAYDQMVAKSNKRFRWSLLDGWCGARLGGSKSNAVNLILRLFLYHFLHTMSS